MFRLRETRWPDAIAGDTRAGKRVDTIAPTIPANIVPTRSSGGMALAWDASYDIVGTTVYYVYRDGMLVGSPVVPSFSETGLTNGVTYSYAIAAADAAFNVSELSDPVDATPNPPGVPGQVFDLVAVALDSAVRLAWAMPENGGDVISDYTVSYRTGAAAFAPYAHVASDAQTITVLGLVNATSYDFKVAAVNSHGTGPASAVVACSPHLTNMLTLQNASVELDDMTWFAAIAGAVSRSTLVAADGIASVRLTQTGSIGIAARTARYTVVPGETYSGLASVRAGSAVRDSYVYIQWLQADGITVVGSTTPVNVADSTSVWTDLASGAAVAPALAVKARLIFGHPTSTPPALDESSYWDKFGLFNGTVAAGNWVAPAA